MTIRDNILHGLPLDKVKYVEAVLMCELDTDLEALPAGDLTEVSENGTNLTEGARARISLARAIYSDNDIFLMDDVISEFDINVKKKLLANIILGHLKLRTRVLVTHQIEYL